MWKSIILILCLGVLSVEDMRKKELSGLLIAVAGLAGCILSLAGGEWQDWRVLYRLIPGLVCLGLGWLTKESIGYGDGLVILCLGCFLDLEELLGVCLAAVTFAGAAALFLLVVLHKGKKTEMPFVPFLLLSYGVTLVI